MSLTAERVRELLAYDPETGVMRWRDDSPTKRKHGGIAGSRDITSGYIRLHVDGKGYLVHRLAWFYMTGAWPTIIDHKNGDRSDNRFVNLRDVNNQQNVENRRLRSANQSGYTGVIFDKDYPRDLKYRVVIGHNGKHINVGRFRTPEEGAAAYHGAKIILHKGFLPGPSVE